MNKIGIIGTGHVGVAAAYSIFQQAQASELILVDKDHSRAQGEALDLMHAQAYASRCIVKAGDYQDLKGCNIVVITAGASQTKGETRLDLLQRNVSIFRSIISKLDQYCPNAILIIATNPVDILTYASQEISQRPHHKIIGTGTMLDTSRFRALLGEHYKVDPKSVHSFIIGEHGDSELPLWSTATIGGLKITSDQINGISFDKIKMDALFSNVKTAAYQIIDKKGYTDLAIGLMITHLIKTILNDQKSILPLSVRLEGQYGIENVCLGFPCIIGAQGIESIITPNLSQSEHELLNKSAKLLQKSIKSITY